MMLLYELAGLVDVVLRALRYQYIISTLCEYPLEGISCLCHFCNFCCVDAVEV